MATRSYAQLRQQIKALEAQADKVRVGEKSVVIAKTKAVIAQYGLAPEDLFGPVSSKPTAAKKTSAKPAKPAKPAKTPKFSDDKGNMWGGMGKRPQWLRDALAAGKQLQDFAVKAVTSAITPDAPPAAKSAPGKKVAAKKSTSSKVKPQAKYADGSGKTWSGLGPKPGWLKDALASGKTLDQLQITA